MRLGICDNTYEHFYGEKKYEMMRAHGFSCADYQGFIDTDSELFDGSERDFEARLKAEKKLADDAGITFFQVHGPWRYPPQDATEEDRAERLEVMKKTIRGAAILGAENWVIHPIMPFGPDKEPDSALYRALNREFFGKLLECAHEFGVTVNLENMPFPAQSIATPTQVLDFVEEFHDDALRICLDTGHVAVFREQPGPAVRQIGKKMLRTLHVHDNDGAHDRHDFPFSGFIDWKDFSAALREIGYDGVLSLETAPKGKMPAVAAEHMLRGLAECARCIAEGC